MYQRITTNTKIQIIIKASFACLFLLLLAGNLFAQYTGNVVRKDKLISVLRSKQLQTREIVSTINTRGVDFQLTPDVEKELLAAGARPEVISAVRGNFRQPARTNDVAPSKSTTTTKKISGEPLGKDAIVTLLENGVADAQVRKNVEARGVNFKTNAQISNQIRQAGGSVALVNLIAGSYVDLNENSGTNSGGAANKTSGGAGNNTSGNDDYETLIDKSVSQYDVAKNVGGSIESLQKAIRLDPNNARGYQLLGFTGHRTLVEAMHFQCKTLVATHF